MKSQGNGSTRRERRHFSAAQKASIVKAHLVDKVAISALCEKHEITPPVRSRSPLDSALDETHHNCHAD